MCLLGGYSAWSWTLWFSGVTWHDREGGTVHVTTGRHGSTCCFFCHRFDRLSVGNLTSKNKNKKRFFHRGLCPGLYHWWRVTVNRKQFIHTLFPCSAYTYLSALKLNAYVEYLNLMMWVNLLGAWLMLMAAAQRAACATCPFWFAAVLALVIAFEMDWWTDWRRRRDCYCGLREWVVPKNC